MSKIIFVNGSNAKCGCRVKYSDGGGEYSTVITVELCPMHDKGDDRGYGTALKDLIQTIAPEWTEGGSEGLLEDVKRAKAVLRDDYKRVYEAEPLKGMPRKDGISFLVLAPDCKRRDFIWQQVSWFEGKLYPDAMSYILNYKGSIDENDIRKWQTLPDT